MPSSGPRGAPFPRRGPARARRPDPAGTGRPGGIRRFARHGGVEPPSTVLETVGLPLSQWRVHVFRSSVFKSRRRPSVRWHATVCVPGRGDPLCGPRMRLHGIANPRRAAKRIGGSPDVLPSAEAGGTLTAKRWPAVAGIGPCMHSGSRVCIRMHPGMHTFFLPVSAWFQRSGDGPEACMHCMHHSLIGDSGKRKETPYIDAYNAYKRKEFCFFLYL